MKPFLLGKKTLDAPPLHSAHHAHRAPVPGAGAPPASAGPQVEVVKQGDKVLRLIVTCSCGERIEVECLYPAGS
jgi:hypothetical protein